METKKHGKKALLAIVAMLVSGGLLIGPSLLAEDGNKAKAQTLDAPVYTVKTAEAQKQTLSTYLDVNGNIASTQQVNVHPDVAGSLVSVDVALGAIVRKGDIIAKVNASRPGISYMDSPVYAPLSGIISQTPISTGSTVSTNSVITVISAMESLEIIARIPEREIAGLSTGLKAEVTLQAYPNETLQATVNRVSPEIDSLSRTKQINLKLDQNDSRINSGMYTRLKIITNTYPDILAVPSEAITTKNGASTLCVIRHDISGQHIAEKREVKTGVTLHGMTEITSGLREGEIVAVQGQQLLSGGETVRIISTIAEGAKGSK